MNDEMNKQMSGTAEGLVEFLEWASRKGELGKNTVIAYKTAVNKIFEIDGETWRSTNIIDVNFEIDRQIDRFIRLRANEYSAKSLRTYSNRFKAAVSTYKRYLLDPSNFRAGASGLPRAKSQEASKPPLKRPISRTKLQSSVGEPSVPTPSVEQSDLVNYPFPLRGGLMVYLSLPRDLRKSEAARIGAFVTCLAVDPVPELGSGAAGVEYRGSEVLK